MEASAFCGGDTPEAAATRIMGMPPELAEVTRYSCGFLFCNGETMPLVHLIRKARPKWQAGRLNGIGGHIEFGETPLDAMRREFLEEAGIDIRGWEAVAVLRGSGFEVHFFSAWAEKAVFDTARTMTDEPIVTVSAYDIFRSDMLPNLRILIPLALDVSGIVKPVYLDDFVPQPV